MRRTEWTDGRLDDKMEGIDSNFDLLRGDIRSLRQEMREEIGGLRTEMREELGGLRSDFASLQTILIQIGFGMVGVLLAAMIALIVAVA